MDYCVTYNSFGHRGRQYFGERRSAINLAKTLPAWRDAVVYIRVGESEGNAKQTRNSTGSWKKIWSYSV